ncbi:MAG: hypothetical protein RIS92_462 [Verrucomicrobiota bacterium]
MERLHRAPSFDGQETFDAIAHLVFRLLERGMIGGWSLPVVRSKVVTDGGGNDEVPVGETLHERARAESVGPVVGEVRFAEDEEPGDVGHEVVVHPETSHRVVHGGVDAHRSFVGIFSGDLVVHVEQIAIALANLVFAQAFDGICEVEVNPEAAGTNSAPVVARLFCGT